ncbi:hypothetical protein KI387_023920, partial [Taxus chinensis]
PQVNSTVCPKAKWSPVMWEAGFDPLTSPFQTEQPHQPAYIGSCDKDKGYKPYIQNLQVPKGYKSQTEPSPQDTQFHSSFLELEKVSQDLTAEMDLYWFFQLSMMLALLDTM